MNFCYYIISMVTKINNYHRKVFINKLVGMGFKIEVLQDNYLVY